MNILMLGAPGSGKGTYGELIAKKLHLAHIASGDLFRVYIKKQPDIAEQVRKIVESGTLVPDDITINLIKERLKEDDAKNGVVFDGFPRTEAQAESLNVMLAECGEKLDVVVNLDIPDEDIVYRLTKRRVCSNPECGATYNLEYHPPKVENICDKCGKSLVQRDDDKEETIKTRLNTYYTKTEGLIKYYKDMGIVYPVPLSKEQSTMAEEISEEMIKHIKSL